MITRGHGEPEPYSIEVIRKILFRIKNILDGPVSRRVRIFFAGDQYNDDAQAKQAIGQDQRVFFHVRDLFDKSKRKQPATGCSYGSLKKCIVILRLQDS